MKRFLRRPSPAMIIAMVALIAALGGTAVAAKFVTKKQVNKIITNRAPGLSVASAKSADTAKSATSADTAKTATGLVDPSLQIRGWGRVDGTGAFIDSRNLVG